MGKRNHAIRSAIRSGAVLAIATLGLGLSGCETVFVQLPESPTTVRVDYPRDPELGRFGTGQIVSWANGPDCAEVLRISSYDPMTLGAKAFRLTAGQRVHLLAEIFPVGPGGLYTNTQCVNLISFTPEAGHNYTLLQTFRDGRCQTAVTDQTSGGPPLTVIEHPAIPACILTPAGYTRVG